MLPELHSITTMFHYLTTCEAYVVANGLEFNPKKSEGMVIRAGNIKSY